MEQAIRIILSIILCVSSVGYAADCPDNVQVIKTGQTANCDGFLFSDAAEKQAEQYRADADYYQTYSNKLREKANILSDENSVLQQRLNLYVQESRTLSQETAKKDNNESLYRFIYFGLGVISTAFVVRNLRQ